MTEPDGGPRSGLRNPVAAVRGTGAVALVTEALVMLLAIVPILVLRLPRAGLAIGVVVCVAVASIALAGLLRQAWAWYAAAALQVALFVAGLFLATSLAGLGVLFALVWAYVLHVRHTVLNGPGPRPPDRATG
jgi:hypothetical protein